MEQHIVSIIRDNQPVYQTRLLQFIQKRHRLMTRSKGIIFLKRMVEKRLIANLLEGRQKLYYYVPGVEEIDIAEIEKLMSFKVSMLQSAITRLKRDYAQTSLNGKWTFINTMLTTAFEGIKECSLMAALGENPEKSPYEVEENAFRAAIRDLVNLVKADKDAALVFPLIRLTLTRHHASREIATRNLPYYASNSDAKTSS